MSGDTLRDGGMSRVLDNVDPVWARRYVEHAANVLVRNRFVTGEDIRLYCKQQQLNEPHHPNAWSAMFNSLAKRDWLTPTNEWTKPSDPTSHSRQIRFWRSQIYRSPDAERVVVVEFDE